MKRSRLFLLVFLILTLAAGACSGCAPAIAAAAAPATSVLDTASLSDTSGTLPVSTLQSPSESAAAGDPSATAIPEQTTAAGSVTVHFLDVGQADSILVQQGGDTLLIDAGNNEDGDSVVAYIKALGIQDLDYVVGTHPHEDHIGGLDTVIKAFTVGKVILPDAVANTETFEDVLLAIKDKGLKISKAVPGTHYSLGQAGLDILGPVLASDDELNHVSVVSKVSFGNTAFLFTGDAEKDDEEAMISQGYDLDADVLKVGHHGSGSSTCAALLQAVSPLYAVISVGQDNTYGHPAAETLARLADAGTAVYRTDLAGAIIAVSDGKQITFNAAPDSGKPGAAATTAAPTPKPTTVKPTTVKPTAQATQAAKPDTSYIGNKETKKFHKPSCSSLPDEKNRISLSSRDEAINAGYVPCKKCNP
ncbi:MAG: MBL fold metallo-hydrolase [Clostridiaceae bacterium]|nr:MBL fold metallo-hydrolase [Clostridiaceae bacterium]